MPRRTLSTSVKDMITVRVSDTEYKERQAQTKKLDINLSTLLRKGLGFVTESVKTSID